MQQEYKTASTVAHIKEHLIHHYDKEVLYLFDIDNTIITTKSDFGKYIDELKALKKNLLKQTERETIISKIDNLIAEWRLAREIILTDKAWPDFVNGKTAYGLTRMDTGKLSAIESMERWRNEELKSISIKFSPQSPIDKIIYSDEPHKLEIADATFFNGIFYTGRAEKGMIVSKILQSNKYDCVVFVDDRPTELDNVAKACSECNVDYFPINFQMNVSKEITVQQELEKKIEEEILKFLQEHE